MAKTVTVRSTPWMTLPGATTMFEKELDQEITMDHEKIATKIRADLGDRACPELIELKAWAIQVARENDLVEGIMRSGSGFM